MASKRTQNNIRKATRRFMDESPGKHEIYVYMLSIMSGYIKKTGNTDVYVSYNPISGKLVYGSNQ